MQIVHFHQGNSGGIVHSPHDSGIAARWQLCNDGGFPSISGRVAAVYDIVELVAGDNPTDDRRAQFRWRQSKLPCRRVVPRSD